MYAVAVLSASGQSNIKTGESYTITEFKKGSGIYYEYFSNLKLSSANWRVAVFVDVKKQNQDLDDLIIRRQYLPNVCSSYYKKCYAHITAYDWNGQWEMAEELKNELENALNDLSKSNKNIPTRLPEGTRIRRRTPLLGFIGKIVGPVTGMMNYDDEDRIDAAIHDLNVAQANISHLIGKQTHVVRAQLDFLHKQAKDHEEELKKMSNVLKDLVDKSEKSMANFSPVLNEIIHTMERKLQHYLKTGTKMLNVIYAARKGQLYQGLLTSHQLLPIMRDIQDNQAGLGIPFRGPDFSIDELMEVSHTSIVLEGNHLKILLDIPLTIEPLYSIYKLHPFPVFQEILGNKTGKAYIDFQSDYLVIDDAQLTHMIINKEDLNSCKKSTEYFLCQNSPAIYDTGKNPSCEIQMLLQPSIEILKTCTVKLQYDDEPFWQRLETIGGWLYSVKDETSLKIKCLSKYNAKINIFGSGVLQLAPGCTARAPTVTLPALQAPKGISEIIYEANVELNLKKLSPILEHWNETLPISETTNLEDVKIESKYNQNSATLDELEQQLNDLSLQRLEKSREWFTPSTYVNYLLIAAGSVVVIYYTYQIFSIIIKRKCLTRAPANQQPHGSNVIVNIGDEAPRTNNMKELENITYSGMKRSVDQHKNSSLFEHGY